MKLSEESSSVENYPKRDQPMIIYAEDLSPMKLTAADLSAHGKAHDQWPEISKVLLAHAVIGCGIDKGMK